MNLTLPRGTGITTYSQNLISVGTRAGYDMQVLLGKDIRHKASPVELAVLLADHQPAPPAQTPVDRIQRRARRMLTRFGRHANMVSNSAEVVWPSGQPPAPTLWHAANIYSDAGRNFRENKSLTRITFRGGTKYEPSISHWTSPIPISSKNCANIYTIHDLIPLKFPSSTNHNKADYYDMIKKIIDSADCIVSVSETTKNDIISLFNSAPQKIAVTYQSPNLDDEILSKGIDCLANELDRQFSLNYRGYFVFFGAIEPKKNLHRILESFLTSASHFPLVIVGKNGWDNDAEIFHLDEITTHGRTSSNIVRHLDYLSRSQLLSLIKGARATIFPSIYEGFGLPALESMALGTPVLTSTAPALVEICQDAAFYADPFDTTSIRHAINALVRDEDHLEELRIKGLNRASYFSPDKYQEKISGIYSQFS
nr:glycosyltransferase family 1 protein [uncultured Brevundimonas sp.]